MNILLMARIIAKTGVGNHVKQLSEELARQGHRVWVVASTNEMGIGEQISGNEVRFQKIELRSKNPVTIWKSLNQIHDLITKNQIEIVHCHHRMAGLFMAWYNLRWKIPYIWTLHLAPIPCDSIHRMMTSYGDKTIAISYEVGEFLKDGLKVPEKDIAYVLNGVDESQLDPVTAEERSKAREAMRIPADKVVIALHSRIASVKNHEAVVEAVGMLTPKERGQVLIICSGEKSGEYYEKIKGLIDQYQIGDCFRFCGWITAREILSCADVLMLPSLKEGFGLNCIEAMFMRIPVLRTKTGGYWDMRDCCIGMEDPSAQTVLKHIRKVLSGEDFCPEMINRAEAFVREQCTVKAMAENTISVYKAVLKAGK